MVKSVFVVGLAGSGKTTVSYSLYEWYHNINQRVAILNLDPGVQILPYTPDVDVREYVTTWDIMEKYSVGPNTAFLLSMDLLLDYVDKINEKVNSINPEILIIDTPGQMEIFAYRSSGKLLVDLLAGDEKMILFVIDGVFVKDPRNLVSNFLVALSVKVRFELPFLIALNKIDMLKEGELSKIFKYTRNMPHLYRSLLRHYSADESMFLTRVFALMKKYGLVINVIPISAITLDNVDLLIQAISRILFRGEEYIEL
ncbi:MAG: ATP/GTP-binding protein [Candidatus Geothermarchaeota archaeon]